MEIGFADDINYVLIFFYKKQSLLTNNSQVTDISNGLGKCGQYYRYLFSYCQKNLSFEVSLVISVVTIDNII